MIMIGFSGYQRGYRSRRFNGRRHILAQYHAFDGHPVEDFQGFYAIGQSPADAFEYDDKFYTNTALKNAGFPVVAQRIADENYAHSDDFPCIVKPIRGRGSQGVVRCACEAELQKAVLDEIASKNTASV